MRPHIAYLKTDSLPWEEILNTGAQRKLLSVDPETGSETAFVRLPPDWHGPAGAHYHSGFEEALLLSGDCDLNGNDLLVAGSYLYRPGGIVHGWVDHSPSGADIIIKMGRATDLISVGEPEYPYEYDYQDQRVPDGRPHIVHLRTADQPWEPWEGDGPGARKKVLSRDQDTGAETLLLQVDANFTGQLDLAADTTWEWVVLKGSMSLADGSTFGPIDYSHRLAGRHETVITSAPSDCTVLLWREA
jgi:quercetin dioxygenase-like cupin family protein